MVSLQIASTELVVERGEPAGASPFLSLDPPEDMGTRGVSTVSIILEPVEDGPAARELAPEVIRRLRQHLNESESAPATGALLNAIELTNRWLVQVNALQPAADRARFGLTCVYSRADDLYIVQVPPSQVIIAQDGELYAFPALDPDGAAMATDGDRWSDGQPLGSPDEVEPELYVTRIEPGDLIVLCSSALGAVIAGEEQALFMTGDADAVIANLGRLVHAYRIADACAGVVVVPEHSTPRGAGDRDLLHTVTEWVSRLLPEETAGRLRSRPRRARVEVDLDGETVQTHEYPEDVPTGDASSARSQGGNGSVERVAADEPVVDPLDEGWEGGAAGLPTDDESIWSPRHARPIVADAGDAAVEAPERGRKLTELLAGAILALSAAVVGVWQLTIHRDHPMAGPRDDGTLGLPRLNRYDDRPQMPDLTGIRRHLPRVPLSRTVAIVLVTLVVVAAGGVAFSSYVSHRQDNAAAVEQLLQTAVQQRELAGQATDPNVAVAYLQAAQARVREAAAIDDAASGLDQERAAIAAEMDRILHIERLANVQVLGGVPAAPDGVTPRVFLGNGQVYILTDALYRFDQDANALVRLIGSGDQIGDTRVGQIQAATWGDGSPVVFDGSGVFVFEPTSAAWTRYQLGTFGVPYAGIGGFSSYTGNIYLLVSQTGQLLKFPAGSYETQPQDWTAGAYTDDLMNAVDMEIDGRVYTLLADGRILDMYMGALENTLTPAIVPGLTQAVALSMQPDRPYIYVADRAGRIIRLSRTDGTVVQQFMAQDGSNALDGIRDIAVDDVLGIAYVLTDQGLVSARLPGPPR